jgi:hypothetical protein
MRAPPLCRAVAVGAATVILLAALPGCALTRSPQIIALDQTERELDLASVDTVLCDHTNPYSPFNVNVWRSICLDDADSYDEAFQRLADARFEHDGNFPAEEEGYLRRADGMTAEISAYPPEKAGLELDVGSDRELEVPADGMVIVTLMLDP